MELRRIFSETGCYKQIAPNGAKAREKRKMTINKYSIGAAIAAVIAIGILAGWMWSGYRIRKLEHAVETAKTEADAKAQSAERSGKQTAEYPAKTKYLEQKLAEIQAIARKQDEELEKINTNTNAARGNAERARSVRSIATTADELCAKLAEVGHPCG